MEDAREKHATHAYPPREKGSAVNPKVSATKSYAKSAKQTAAEQFTLEKQAEVPMNDC